MRSVALAFRYGCFRSAAGENAVARTDLTAFIGRNLTMIQTNTPLKVFLATTALFLATQGARAAALPPGFVEITLASGFTNASALVVAPDGRVFVGQQNGVIRVVKNGVLLPTPFVRVPADSNTDRGLIGLTIDPGFLSNDLVYVSYTATNTAVAGTFLQRISRLTASGDVALPGSETILFETDAFAGSVVREVGGGLRFGPDGLLYAGMGRSGPDSNSQTLNSQFGKILRLNSDGSIPPSNPFFATAVGKNRAIWAVGLRNPFALSFQPGTGRMFINDVGQLTREEINEGVMGTNYGWPVCEGPCVSVTNLNPVFSYSSAAPAVECAITGGTFYNPAAALFPPQFVGNYFYSDYCSSKIYALQPATTNSTVFASNIVGFVVALDVGPEGSLYCLGHSASPTGGGVLSKFVPGVETLLPFGSTWKYLDTGISNIPANWVQSAFDDSTWSNGLAQLGWGINGEVTLVRSNRTDLTRITTTYFRKSFVLTNTAPYSNYVVSLVRDDGGVVYLNGTEVFRSNMSTGLMTSTNLALVGIANNDERATHGAVLNPSLLLHGTNQFAVEIHQQSIVGTSIDMSFDLSLLGVNGGATLRALSSGGGITLAYPLWASRFAVESTTNLTTASWLPVPTNGATAVGNELQLPLNTTQPLEVFRLRSP